MKTDQMDWVGATLVVPQGEGTTAVSGFSLAEFGICEREIRNPVTQGARSLAHVVHIPSGVLFGIFDTMELAKVAGRLANETLGDDFAEMNPDDKADEFDSVIARWLEAGMAAVNSFGDTTAVWHGVRGPGGVAIPLGIEPCGPTYPENVTRNVIGKVAKELMATQSRRFI